MVTRFARHDALVISFSTDGPLTPPEFQEWLDKLAVRGVRGFLSAAVGTVGFTSAQRSAAAAHAKSLGIRTAVVTDDRIGRGIVTAVSWLGADIRAFSWADIELAAAHLGIHSHAEQRMVAETVWALRRSFDAARGTTQH